MRHKVGRQSLIIVCYLIWPCEKWSCGSSYTQISLLDMSEENGLKSIEWSEYGGYPISGQKKSCR